MLNLFSVKLSPKLIILLFLFLSHSSISQNLKNNTAEDKKAISSRTPLDTNRYQKIQVHQDQRKRGVTESSSKDKKELKKVKSEGRILTQHSQKTSVLNDLLVQYWMVQNDIKRAKKENDLAQIVDLEKRSLRYRRDYVLTFENLKNTHPSLEQQKVYKAFKKDFAYE